MMRSLRKLGDDVDSMQITTSNDDPMSDMWSGVDRYKFKETE